MADEMVFERPDDPYTLTVWSDSDGIHIKVSADVLDDIDIDTRAVQAETRRRVELLRRSMIEWLSPPKRDIWSPRS